MKIGVLGSGQLGRMLALSAYPLGHQMSFLASSEEDHSSLLGNTFIQNGSQEIIEEFAKNSDVVTYESENTAINPDRLTAAGRGEFAPIAQNDSKEGKSKNRRIEVVLTPKLDEISRLLNTN